MEIRKLAPGDRILDYRILERLGEGGFGEVFRGEHEVLGRIVAIKVPRDPAGLAALRHEGVVQASLDHPGIVRTLELSISHDPPYVVMEYVDGSSLAGILKRESAGLPWKRAARILLEAARALEHAHSRGVIHGDVKPGNILVEGKRKGRVLLTDFGLGRVFEGPQGNLQISRSLELATSGAEVQGTIRYLAPELLRGESADARADLYSFSVLLFECLTGRLPEGREIPSDHKPDLPEELDRLFTRSFARREKRPRSFAETVETLERLLEPPRPAGASREVVRAIPAEPEPTATRSSARRNHTVAPAPAPAPPAPGTEFPGARRLDAEVARSGDGFRGWRDGLLERVHGRLAKVTGVVSSDGQGFDACFGVNTEGEPHHKVYALVLPRVDGSVGRATVAEARRIFDQEKGIWEKEVTFWVIAQRVEEVDQVLWTFKSFSMGWWRRRRIVLQDLQAGRVYAAELGCDPRGNPLKRSFLEAVEEAVRMAPRPRRASPARARPVRGTVWGAALAMLMTIGLLGGVLAVDLARRSARPVKAEAAAVTSVASVESGVAEGYVTVETPTPVAVEADATATRRADPAREECEFTPEELPLPEYY